MVTCGQIFDFLSEKFPLFLACDFDNAGFLVGDKTAENTGALICLDCTLSAVKTAKAAGKNLIITHHPVIFEGLKTVTKGSVIYELIKSDISVISLHTNLDVASGGVNDCLCRALGLKNIENYTAADGFNLRRGELNDSADVLANRIKTALDFNVRYVGNGQIKKVLVCSGSGGDYITEAAQNGFDALITADCKHHQFIFAQNSGIALYDCGHYASENVVIRPLCELLKAEFKETDFSVYDNKEIKFL